MLWIKNCVTIIMHLCILLWYLSLMSLLVYAILIIGSLTLLLEIKGQYCSGNLIAIQFWLDYYWGSSCRLLLKDLAQKSIECFLFQELMVDHMTYTPPSYIPLGQSDVEADVVPPADAIPATQDSGQGQWSSGICACFDDMQSCMLLFALWSWFIRSKKVNERCLLSSFRKYIDEHPPFYSFLLGNKIMS